MLVALLGDVHANLPALEAVLEHAASRQAQAIWNIGDFVGYGAFPEESVRRLRQAGAVSIAGNYDLKVLRFPRKRDKWRQTKRPEKFFAFGWAYEQLSEESRLYLRGLPLELRLEQEGWRVLLTHGSPASNEEHLTPQTPESRLVELAGLARAQVVICGHSHQPFARWVDAGPGPVLFINTGSVGRPDDGDPRACYALLRLEPGELSVEHFRLEYDLERAVAATRQRGLPEAFARMILQGRDLEAVKS